MAVGNRERSGSFYTVAHGKIIKSLGKEPPSDMEDVVERVNKNGVKVYELHYDYIRGKIIDAEMELPPEEHPDYGKRMVLTILDAEGNTQKLNISFDSSYGRGFLMPLDNVKLEDPIEIEPYQYIDKKTGKEKTGLGVYQYGKQLDWAMGTKDNPGGVPRLEEVVYKGKKSWDNTKQLAFLEKYFDGFVSQLKALNADVDAEPVEDDAPPF